MKRIFISSILLTLVVGFTAGFYLQSKKVKAENVSSVVEYIYVDIKGEVVSPGVYRVSDTTRLFQVIQIAGGLTPQANTMNINLAVKLADEQMILIPSSEETVDDNLVNINTANSEILDTLPGIGEKIAQDIVAYREAIGSFTRVEDLLNVTGIGQATLEKIKPYITV